VPKSIIVEGPATRQAAPPRRAVVNIDLAQIITRDRLRKLRPDKVDALAESINAQGQLQPIIVQRHGADYLLIAGRHRLQAARQLKHDTIRAEIAGELDADQALLIEIDENLMRAELSPAERALHVSRRKGLYEKAHPETKHGGDRKSGGSSSQNENLNFVADTAAKTGKGRSTVARDVTRANKVGVLDEIIGTPLDKGSEIDALAKLPQEEQRELADRAKAGEEVTARYDHYHYRKDGRIDRRLERFETAISGMCAAGNIGSDEIKFPPNLTHEMVAEAREKIKEAIVELRKLDARLAAYVGNSDGNNIDPQAPADARSAADAEMTADPLKDFLQTQNRGAS
jgi:uncharacterized ParB-like nuclease family protein